ncbi:MAG: hypothetical protein HFG34_12890 [Eubacterium sp.]|nr:hypothetical protein [Eubacterium sp.]MCI8824697.1 hypothetical protein [Lachnospiraceae bacterium]
METVKKFCEEINEPSRTELNNKIIEQEEEILELYDLINTLEYNLKMARQVLSDNIDYYFELEDDYLKYSKEQGSRRNDIAIDYIFWSINKIKETENRLHNKEGES